MRNIQYLLLMLAFSLTMTACQPALKEFQPDNISLFKITFSYPADWTWKEVIPFDEPPLDKELPLSERFIVSNGSLEKGLISIQVYITPEPHTEAREWIDGFSSGSAFTVLDDTTLQIDGYEARWLTLSTIGYSALNKKDFQEVDIQDEVVYLFTEDRYYTFDISLLESQINGRVHKEFEELIKTIKVLQ
jgi:hypothetical protein